MKENKAKHSDRNISAIIVFLFIIISDIIAIILGFGGSFVSMFRGDTGIFSSYESLFISSAVICGVLMTVLYSYKNNHRKKIIAIGLANLIISLAPYILNSVYYPFSFMVTDFLFDIGSSFSDLRFLTGELISVPLCILCFVLNIKLKRKNGTRTISINTYIIILFLTISFFLFINIFNLFITTVFSSQDNFNYSAIGYYFENIKKNKNLDIYNSIKEDMTVEDTEALLAENGFFPHNQAEKYIIDEEDIEFELNILKEYIVNGDETVYTKPDSYGYISYYNPCIIISDEETGIVKKKKITFGSFDSYRLFDLISIGDDDYIYRFEELFKGLKLNEEKETVLRQIRKYDIPNSLETEYKNNSVLETYNICAYQDNSFLSLYDNEYFDGYLVFEDGILSSGNYTYTHEHTDYDSESRDVIEEVTEYIIK